MSEEDFHEQWLQANANAGYMSHVLADLVRRIMRASMNRDGGQQYEAMEALKLFLGLVGRSKDVTIHDLIEGAVQGLAVEAADGSDGDRLDVAQNATRYLLELSCDDNAARGRASRRWNAVESSFRNLNEMREYRARKWREEHGR